MNQVKCENMKDIPGKHKCEHDGYEFQKQSFIARNEAKGCKAAVYTIPPQKTGYPYHYHLCVEEIFFIISGTGLLRTPDGEREVHANDLLYFPANELGAHKLSNLSDTEDLVYLDFDTTNEIDLSFYPDSNKFGIWGKEINKVYHTNQNVDYYQGE